MAIRDTYAELITEQILKEILTDGDNPSVSEIASRFKTFTDTNDISQPLFEADNYKVDMGQSSSVTSWNSKNNDILRDMKVLYKHLFKVSDQLVNNFERWRSEGKLLEGRLDDLEERITSLLLLSNDTAGFFNFVQDNFVDNSKVDLAESNALVNVDKGVVSIGTSSVGVTRVLLPLVRDEDIEFSILSKTNLISSVSASESRTRNIVNDINNFWQERVYTNKPGSMSAELKIDFGEELTISRIDVDLHQANTNSAVQVTPMFSLDNFNYNQLRTSNFTRNIIDKSTFQFPPTTARYVKFIMTKPGFDVVHNGLYSYEFGVDEISFYNEGFDINTTSVMLSKALSVLDTEGNEEEFSKIVLETCEDIPDGTSIDYSVAAFENEDDVLLSSAFASIDPINRVTTTKPTVLDFGDLDEVSIPSIGLSYDATSVSGVYINPAKEFTIVTSISSGSAVTSTATSSGVRYSFFNSNDRILDHTIGSGVQIAQGTLELWRNINTQGSTTKVRGVSNGWGSQDPHYKTTIYVDNPAGTDIDFGGKAVIIDGVSQTGKVNIEQGKHSLLVHKDNWKLIDSSGVTDLASLKTADSLYPYNHRYLVEGFSYPAAYPDDEEKVYKGFDIVAEFFVKEVSVFDMIHNVLKDDYDRFAIDLDAADVDGKIDGSPEARTPTKSFLLKVDENNPDFINEDFLIKFKSANSLFKFLRLKATLKTTDATITPFLDSYRIKISS